MPGSRVAALVVSIVLFADLSIASAASQWKELTTVYPTPEANFAIYMTSLSTGCAGATGEQILKTNTGGLSWESHKPNLVPDNVISSIRFVRDNSNIGYAASPGTGTSTGYIYKTTDAGNTWSLSKIFALATEEVNSVFPLSATEIWACGAMAAGNIAYSTDSGATWNNYSWGSAYPTACYDIFFDSGSNGYVCGNRSIRKKSSGSSAWTEVYANVSQNFFGVDFVNPSLGLAVGHDNAANAAIILRSADGGSTWTQVHSVPGASYQFRDVAFVDATTAYACGNWAGGVMKSTDGGLTWGNILTGLPTGSLSFESMSFLDQHNGWLAGFDGTFAGRIFKWVVDPDVTSIIQSGTSVSNIPQGFSGNIDLAGTNLRLDSVINFGADVTLNSLAPITPAAFSYSTMRANITVGPAAAAGARTITITNPDTGTSAYASFTISARPTIASAEPASSYVGWSGNVRIDGANFVSGATVGFNTTDIEMLSTTLVSSSQLNATVRVKPAATAGLFNLTVTNPDNGTASSTFEILSTTLPPTMSNIRINDRGYDTFQTISTSMPVDARPKVAFDLNASLGVSLEGFKIYISQPGQSLVTYDRSNYISTNYWSGTNNAGTFTYTLPADMRPGNALIIVYGQDARGAGASSLCYVVVPDPATARGELIGNIVPSQSPWNPAAGPVKLQLQFDNDPPAPPELNILDSSGQVVFKMLLTGMRGGYNTVTWDGTTAFGGRVANGLYPMPIVVNGRRVGSGMLIVVNQ